jgi:hypothetical protein
MTGSARRGLRSWREKHARGGSRLTTILVALSLLVQLVIAPYHQALSEPAFGPSDLTRVAAELKATFGGAAALCVQTDDDPSKAPLGCCDDDCPFCRFAAEAAILVIPDFPALPIRRNVAAHIGLPPESRGPPATPIRRQRARAPPFAV